MIKICITGGIGCGKTTVSNIFFNKYRIPTIDTDSLAHLAVSKGSEGLDQVVNQFGTGVLNNQGELDRIKIKKIIFTDASKRGELEAIIHPIVYQLIKREIKVVTANFCLIAVPILRKSSSILSLVDRVLFVDCQEVIRIKRTISRDNLDVPLIKNIIKSQPTRMELKQIADDTIENNGSITELKQDITKLQEKYQTLLKS